jgi:hypothetical protein
MTSFSLAATFILHITCLVHSLNTQQEDKAQQTIDFAIKSHGVEKLSYSRVSFHFRGKKYTAYRDFGSFRLIRSFEDTINGAPVSIRDELSNTGFVRYENERPVEIPKKKASALRQSVNSVHYFFQLPYSLNDEAVKKQYLGEVEIESELYDKIRISFNEVGGGDDHEDIFIYWINKRSGLIDYLAYQFHVNGGGIRFRKAVNRKTINGVTVQDYLNYKPQNELLTLTATDEAYKEGQLVLLSEIINEQVDIDIY